MEKGNDDCFHGFGTLGIRADFPDFDRWICEDSGMPPILWKG